ncbi:acetyl-CoA carboxylase biotin carboxyl carrier protein [Pseudobutyrivibrio sp. YE44]|uniref:acetyl-CoA carboxylase biotin carboxyl carrier protein n=1 Tax=Pseudobutyrivibrio sp. YE44 TaxID=1520802 RepID=UPI00087E068A|nr:acetyl-CoA carboxylase biotin carboxyl carrier protein [Pseudobutyrivibrio sp. YE44]SDB48699.1 acetyl-CoA carboxylase biotin carboxyl carrier protein [Pseudobutyrivibrio sp. YE44]
MDTKEIKELLKAFDESGSSYLKIKEDGFEIQFKKPEANQQVVVAAPVQTAPQQVAVAPVTEITESVAASAASDKAAISPEDGEVVKAPLVGVFYSAPSPEEKPYVQVGDKVQEGQVLCLIEAMKMMSEITAPKDGIVKDIFAKNQDVVGFEEPLFLIAE